MVLSGDVGPVDELGRPLRRARFRGYVVTHKRDPSMPGLIRLPNLKGLEKITDALFEVKRARVDGMPLLIRLVKEKELLFEKGTESEGKEMETETESEGKETESEGKETESEGKEMEMETESEEKVGDAKEGDRTEPDSISDEATESQSDIVWDSESEGKTEEKGKEVESSEILDLAKTSSSGESTQTEDSIINVLSD